MDFKSPNSSPEGSVPEMRTKRPKPVLTLSYHLPTGVVQGRLTEGGSGFSRGGRSPALVPIRSPVEPPAPRSPFGPSSAILKAPHLSQSKESFSPLPPTPTTAPCDAPRASVFETYQAQFLQAQSSVQPQKKD
ncbi:hypothetical protein PTTG_05132 [Puccinia triticina 1-1 BBBD Race 1]|uniref:Uncharacterized protein n=1 Tax=Puccinia triticina (isolate 1-1 / race 1 (BBBD)) TaxID=630390 RepID=A0A0C4EWD7_PUCT1|nr:hypothetical protein PTTG_05132 [Puccinia triticina 1-1 BBBD Race 1]WAR63718.1 hypothetical protein PtB15_17B319 [Puccinia triticina]